jgi:hypothetical protein
MTSGSSACGARDVAQPSAASAFRPAIAANEPRMMKSPCAVLVSRMTPKISDCPSANSA